MEPRYDATTVLQQKRYSKVLPPFGRRRPLPAAAPRARTGSVARDHGARPRACLRRRDLRGRRGRRRERAHRAQRAGPDRHRLRDAVLHVQGLAPPLAGPGKHVLLRQAAARRRVLERRRAPGVFAASRRGRRIRGGGGGERRRAPGRRGPTSRRPRGIRSRLISSRALLPSVSRRRRFSRYSTSTSLAAVDVAASVSQLWSFNVVGAITMSIMAVGLVVGYAAGARSAEQHRR